MMGSIVSLVLGFFRGPFSGIVKELKEAFVEKQNAKTEEARIAAQERIDGLQLRQEIILKAQGDPIEKLIRVGFALPYVIYLWKLIVWDKVFELGVTDSLSPELSYIWMMILGGYFLDMSIKRARGY